MNNEQKAEEYATRFFDKESDEYTYLFNAVLYGIKIGYADGYDTCLKIQGLKAVKPDTTKSE